MARRPKDTPANGASDGGILAQVPSVEHLETRLAELTAEAARVERLLACIRSLSASDAADTLTTLAEVA